MDNNILNIGRLSPCLTLSPMRVAIMLLAAAASWMVSRLSRRVAGLSVVSHSCSGIISPSPLNL
jgi:hypothetical protein